MARYQPMVTGIDPGNVEHPTCCSELWVLSSSGWGVGIMSRCLFDQVLPLSYISLSTPPPYLIQFPCFLSQLNMLNSSFCNVRQMKLSAALMVDRS